MENNIEFSTVSGSIAIVSGKGGSGKTMIAAVTAQLIDRSGEKILIVDADFATGGLTYYMGLTTVKNISTGLTNFIRKEKEQIDSDSINRTAQEMISFQNSRFIGVGDHRRFYKEYSSMDLESMFPIFINRAKEIFDIIIIDCRGGIDSESLSVCKVVEEILLVVETDTTSFQATQHLVDVLYDNDLSDKLSGFMINKAFDDPNAIARNGTAAFRTQYLGSIPFDLEAMRSFLIGEIPKLDSYFSSQLAYALLKWNPHLFIKPVMNKMEFRDFKGLTIRDNESSVGGILLSFLAFTLGISIIAEMFSPGSFSKDALLLMIVILIFVGSLAGIERGRKFIGRIYSVYAKFFRLIFSKLEK